MTKDIGKQLLARLDRIPVWPFPYFVIFVVGIGFLFAFFDVITIGLALPVISQQFNISEHTGLWLITSGLIGYIVGSLLDSVISDLFGRRLALMLSVAFFSVGSILSATSPNFEWLFLWRFIIGMGLGSEIANVSTYMGELSPAACRGKVSSIALCMGFLGFAIIPFISMALVPNFSWGWRVLFLIGGFGGIITLILRRYIPQSIRWFVYHQQFDQAEQLLLKAEALATKRYKKPLPTPDHSYEAYQTTQQSKYAIGLLTHLFSPAYLRWVILLACVWFVYYIGNYGWLTLSSDLLVDKGFSLAKSLMMICITSLGFVAGCIIPMSIGDRIERKWLLIATSSAWTILLSIIAFFPNTTTLLIAGFFASATISCLVPTLYIYTAEHFPTACRATGVSITDGIGHLGAAFCGQIILGTATLTSHYIIPFKMAFLIMAFSGALTAALLCFGKKRTGQILEQ